MFHVSTCGLSPDQRHAGKEFGSLCLGEISAERMTELLNLFANIEPVEIYEAEPHLIVKTRVGKFLIRTSQNKLHVYNARNITDPSFEITPSNLGALDGSALAAKSTTVTVAGPTAALRPNNKNHQVILATVLWAIALSINGFTVYSLLATEADPAMEYLQSIANPVEIEAQKNVLIGDFFTGDLPGDHFIRIQSDAIRFGDIREKTAWSVSGPVDYSLAKREGRICLKTRLDGIIETVNADTLFYCGDTYRRRK